MEARKRICVRAQDAADMLSISRSLLFKLDIPYVKINNCRIYKVSDLEDFADAHKVLVPEVAVNVPQGEVR